MKPEDEYSGSDSIGRSESRRENINKEDEQVHRYYTIDQTFLSPAT
jgi:hypothetical protein